MVLNYSVIYIVGEDIGYYVIVVQLVLLLILEQIVEELGLVDLEQLEVEIYLVALQVALPPHQTPEPPLSPLFSN